MLAERPGAASRGDSPRASPSRFDEIGYREGATGAPLIHDTLAAVECRIVDLLAGGDHTIVIGEVEATHVGEGKPLLYFRGGYGQLA